ncbi:MAG: T9SS type A sorting domain-containing protein [Bacteroidetes bacterium]|nr:T9SS type A sorting domain-containing protein [Bacteroidota bacterium]
MKKITTIFIILCISILAKAHSIDSLKIIPPNPTTNDYIKVVAYTMFTSGSCAMIDSSVAGIGTGTTITIDACHNVGMLTVICHSTDTVSLGFLAPGNYSLNYFINTTDPFTDPTTCNILHSDSISKSFVVAAGGPSAIDNINPLFGTLQAFPNPTTGLLAFDPNMLRSENGFLFTLYNVRGELVTSLAIDKNHPKLDISTVGSGVYYYRLESGSNVGAFQKIVVVN